MVKNKTGKIEANQKKRTLDQKHTEYISKFDSMNNELPIKRTKLSKLKRELNELLCMHPDECSREDIHRKSVLMDIIANLTSEINEIENCTEPLQYIVDTLPILVDYYDNKNLIEDGMEEFIDNYNDTGKKNILTYFMKEPALVHIKPVISGSKTTQPKTSKAQLYNNYLNITDITHTRPAKKKQNKCNKPDCDGTILVSDGNYVCDICGVAEPYFSTYGKPNYKEQSQDSGVYAYKRINHLTEILSQLQAKESTDIPPRVFESIHREIKKRKICKFDLDIFKLRRILKKLNLRKYYEHVPHILQIINGKEPPNFSRRDEAKIKKMFKDIQKPFTLFCPKNRKNFLNYSYVLHKFCELLDLDDYISYFPLLKNNTKLLQHDRIWKNICEYMHWKMYRSL